MLFSVLARAAEWRLGESNAQVLANSAWAFATADQPDVLLFAAFAEADRPDALLFATFARMAERRLDKINAQELANTAWAFATVC